MAGLHEAPAGEPLAIAFDAHGDFNTPDTTPSGNVWGMPFAMICGRGDEELVEACGGPTVYDEHVPPSSADRCWTSRSHGCSQRPASPTSGRG